MIGWNTLRTRTVTALVGGGVCNGSVSASRFKPTRDNELPTARVYVRAGGCKPVGGKANAGAPKYIRTTKLIIAILAKGNGAEAESWLSDEIEKALDLLMENPAWLDPETAPFVEEVNAIEVVAEELKIGEVNTIGAAITLDVVDRMSFRRVATTDLTQVRAVDEDSDGRFGVDLMENGAPDGASDAEFGVDLPTE